MSEIPATARPDRRRRDALAQICFALHVVVMIFIIFGWIAPIRAVLLFYVVFLPLVVLQWQFNKNSCVLNNIESLVRTGGWRDPTNAEEGAWLLGLVRSVLGLELRPAQFDVFIHTMLVIFWGLGVGHLLRS